MSNWQPDDPLNPENDDYGSFGTQRSTLEHWDKGQLEALEFLHPRKDLQRTKPNLDQLLQDVELSRGLYESKYGFRIVPKEPHEYPFALVLRPFSRPPLNGEIP